MWQYMCLCLYFIIKIINELILNKQNKNIKIKLKNDKKWLQCYASIITDINKLLI